MKLENYWWLLIWLFVFGLFNYIIGVNREEVVDGQPCVRWNPIMAYLLVVPYVIWAGWRQGFGDTEQYRATFMEMPSTVDKIFPYMSEVEKGHGFKLFELLFTSYS